MHNAPPVLVPVGRFVLGARIAVACGAFSLLTGLLLVCLFPLTGARQVVLLGTCLLAAGLACSVWRLEALPEGELGWDGQNWFFHVTGAVTAWPEAVQLVWDGGHFMLLALDVQRPDRSLKRQYTCVQASRCSSQWHGLRCAVHGSDTL